MTDELRADLATLVKEVRAIHGTVDQIHARQEASDKRIEELHRDHLQLKDRVSSISSELRLMQQAATMQKSADTEKHNALEGLIAAVSAKLDKITSGLFVASLTIILGLAVLLYQTLISGVVS